MTCCYWRLSYALVFAVEGFLMSSVAVEVFLMICCCWRLSYDLLFVKAFLWSVAVQGFLMTCCCSRLYYDLLLLNLKAFLWSNVAVQFFLMSQLMFKAFLWPVAVQGFLMICCCWSTLRLSYDLLLFNSRLSYDLSCSSPSYDLLLFKDPLKKKSICHKRVGLTASGMVTQKYCAR